MGKSNIYYDINNRGRFCIWFEEEEMDLSGMDEEFYDFDECSYLGFHDDEFPFNDNILEKYKEELQFEIMKYCFNNCRSPTLYQIEEMYTRIKLKYHDIDDINDNDKKTENNDNNNSMVGIFDNIDFNIMYDEEIYQKQENFIFHHIHILKN